MCHMEQREQKQQAKMRQQQARQTLAARAGYAEKVKKGCVCVVHFNRWGTEKEKGLRLVCAFLASFTCLGLRPREATRRQPRLRPPSFKQAAHIKLKHTSHVPLLSTNTQARANKQAPLGQHIHLVLFPTGAACSNLNFALRV